MICSCLSPMLEREWKTRATVTDARECRACGRVHVVATSARNPATRTQPGSYPDLADSISIPQNAANRAEKKTRDATHQQMPQEYATPCVNDCGEKPRRDASIISAPVRLAKPEVLAMAHIAACPGASMDAIARAAFFRLTRPTRAKARLMLDRLMYSGLVSRQPGAGGGFTLAPRAVALINPHGPKTEART